MGKLARALTIITCIRDAPGSDFSQDAYYVDGDLL